MARSAKAAGITASCPSLRHPCASNLLEAGAEGERAQGTAGTCVHRVERTRRDTLASAGEAGRPADDPHRDGENAPGRTRRPLVVHAPTPRQATVPPVGAGQRDQDPAVASGTPLVWAMQRPRLHQPRDDWGGRLWKARENEGTNQRPGLSDARGVPYSARVRGPVARVSKTSAKARWAIMPRGALRPVWTSRWARERSSCANRSTGRRRVTLVAGAPCGRPACVCGVVSALDCGRLPGWACRGCRGAAGLGDASGQGCRGSPHL